MYSKENCGDGIHPRLSDNWRLPTDHVERVEADSAKGEEPDDGLQHRFGDPDEGGGERGAEGGAEELRVRQEGAGEHEENERGKEAGS